MNLGVPSGLTPPLSSLFASSLVGSVMKPHKGAVTVSLCPLGSSPGSASLCGLHSSQRTCSLRSGAPTPAPEGFRDPSLSGGGGGQCHASRDIAHILGEGVEGCQPVSQAKPAWNALEAWLPPSWVCPGLRVTSSLWLLLTPPKSGLLPLGQGGQFRGGSALSARFHSVPRQVTGV